MTNQEAQDLWLNVCGLIGVDPDTSTHEFVILEIGRRLKPVDAVRKAEREYQQEKMGCGHRRGCYRHLLGLLWREEDKQYCEVCDNTQLILSRLNLYICDLMREL